MIDYKRWPIKDLNVTGLSLDPKNPRVPPTKVPMTQPELIKELVQHDDVFELARKISNQGYFPTETLVAVKENGTTYVVEGNRRLAALKLLINPQLAPSEEAARFKQLTQNGAGAITKIRVVIAPTREYAAPLLMSRHTGTEIQKWTPIMQARFYESLLAGGLTTKDLADAYGGTEADVLKYLRTYKLYQMARALSLPEATRKIVDDPRKFSITNLTRLTDTKRVQDFLGLRTDKENLFEVTIHPDEFRKGFRKMVIDVAHDKVTSRSHNTKKEIDSYLKGFGDNRPDKNKKGKATADELVGDGSTSVTSKPVGTAKPTSKPTPTSILPLGCVCELENERINDIFRELKELRVAKFRNASAIMFRSLIDMAVSHFFDENAHTALLKTKLNKSGKSPRPADWHPSLDQMLKYVLETPAVPLNATGRKALQKLVSGGKDSPLTLESMNGFVHNRYTTPTVAELRSISGMIQPLLELVLRQPPKPAQSK